MIKLNYKKGFTLIELLVVIAIIGVLSSVVLASLATARLKAKDAVIKSSLAQIETLMQAEYAETGSYAGLQPCWDGISINATHSCSDLFPIRSGNSLICGGVTYDASVVTAPTSGAGILRLSTFVTSPYRNEAVKLCEQIVANSNGGAGGEIAYFGAGNTTVPETNYYNHTVHRFERFSMGAYLPSSGKWLCVGLNGKSEVLSLAQALAPVGSSSVGCFNNP